MFLLLITAILNWQSVLSDAIQDPTFHRNPNNLIQSSLAHFLPSIKPLALNVTSYIDRGENILRVPNITKHDDHEKKKSFKKSPRRTIQKIIKKTKLKRKNSNNNNQYATQPTQTKEKFDQYDIYAKEELSQQKNNATTTQSNQKKQRKWNKLARYPMPFQKLSLNREAQKNMNVFRRNKRSGDRKDVFILKDLDELEFVSKNKDYDVIKAHVQTHW